MSDDDVVVDPKTAEIRAYSATYRYVGPWDCWEVDITGARPMLQWSSRRVAQLVGARAVLQAVAGIGREDYAAVLAGLLEVDVADVLPRVAP